LSDFSPGKTQSFCRMLHICSMTAIAAGLRGTRCSRSPFIRSARTVHTFSAMLISPELHLAPRDSPLRAALRIVNSSALGAVPSCARSSAMKAGLHPHRDVGVLADGHGRVQRGLALVTAYFTGYSGRRWTLVNWSMAERESAGQFEIASLFNVSIKYPRLYLRGLSRKPVDQVKPTESISNNRRFYRSRQ
jgi:hypothetical protein